jgi:hypothetical protein
MVGPGALVAPGDDVAGQTRLILAHVGQQVAPVDVADSVQPGALNPGHAQAVVDVEVAARLEPDGGQAHVVGDGPPAGGHQDLVDLDGLLAQPQRGRRIRPGALDSVDAGAQAHVDAVVGQPPAHVLAGEGLLARQQPVVDLDDGHLLAAQSLEGLGQLGAGHAAADHAQAPGDLRGLGGVAVVPRGGLGQPRDGGNGRSAAGGQHHRPRGGQRARVAVGGGHGHAALAVQAPVAAH